MKTKQIIKLLNRFEALNKEYFEQRGLDFYFDELNFCKPHCKSDFLNYNIQYHIIQKIENSKMTWNEIVISFSEYSADTEKNVLCRTKDIFYRGQPSLIKENETVALPDFSARIFSLLNEKCRKMIESSFFLKA